MVAVYGLAAVVVEDAEITTFGRVQQVGDEIR
jgi:hypothetical protein